MSCDVCHSVSRVVTRHAGGGANGSIVLEEGEVRFGPIREPIATPAHESRYSERFYTVSCMRGDETIKSIEAVQSAESTMTLPLACKDVDAVRLDFRWDPDSATGHIRIYEIEVWGK